MKKIQLFFLLICVFPMISIAQTWNGTTSSDWNTASNWTPNGVPLSTGNVIINQVNLAASPKLSSGISVNSITMNEGSVLDVNGYTITTANYFRTNGTLTNPVSLNNSTPSVQMILNLNGVTSNYFYGTEVNEKISINTNSNSTFTIGNGTNICTFTDDVSIQSSGSGALNISTNATNIFGGSLIIDMLSAASLNLFTTSDTSKVSGNFQLTNLSGGNTMIGNLNNTTVISGTMSINYNAPGMFSPFSLLNLKNLTSGGQVLIQNTGATTNISKDTLLVNEFSVINYNNLSNFYALNFNSNRISGNTLLSDSITNSQAIMAGNNEINGDFTILNNGNITVNESYYGGNTVNGNVLFSKKGSGTFKASSNATSTISGNYEFQCTNGGTVQLFNTGNTTIGGSFKFTDSFGTTVTLGNSVFTTPISGKVDIYYNAIASNPAFSLVNLKNFTSGGQVFIQNTGKTSAFSNNTILANPFIVNNYNNTSNFYALLYYNNTITGKVTISDSATNTMPLSLGKNAIDGDFSIINNGNVSVDESAYGGNSVSGNVLYVKKGNGSFRASSSTTSNILGNYEFQCWNDGSVQLFFFDTTIIGGNFTYSDTFGATTQIGNAMKTTLISGKVNFQYDGSSQNKSFSLTNIKNFMNGGSISITGPGKLTKIYKDTLLVNGFTLSHYNNETNFDNLNFNDNSISGNTFISDSATNLNSLKMGQNHIAGDFTVMNNGNTTVDLSSYGANEISGNVLYIKNGFGPFKASSNGSSVVSGNYEFQCNNGGGVQLFIYGTTTIGGDFIYTDIFGPLTQIGNNTNTTFISGMVNIDYNGNSQNNSFELFNIKNGTGGGNVLIHRPGLTTTISNDTLLVDNFTVSDYNNQSNFYSLSFFTNQISGNTSLSDTISNLRSFYLGGNSIGGDYTIVNNGNISVDESYYANNSVGGNVLYTKNGSGTFKANSNGISNISGNYTYKSKNGLGNSILFTSGKTTIGGNFILEDSAGTNTQLGNLLNQTLISGKTDITYNGNGLNHPFKMYGIKNLTAGGEILIENSGNATSISNDTLLVNNLSVINYTNLSNFDELNFNNNKIFGTTHISDSSTNTNQLKIGGNIFEGDFYLTGNGAATIYESYSISNIYNGIATFIKNGTNQLIVGFSQNALFTKELFIQPSALLNLKAIEMNGNTDGKINQLGLNPVQIAKLIVNKRGTATISSNAPVTITGSVEFLNGNIITDVNKELIFADNATAVTPSDSSKALGPVSKIGNDNFYFPIGSATRLVPLYIAAPSVVTDQFTATYIDKSATLDGFDTDLKALTLGTVTDQYYFDLKRDNGNSLLSIRLGYNLPPGEISDTASLRVAHWNGSTWVDYGNDGVSGDNLTGYVKPIFVISDFGPFALASTDAQANPLPLKLLSFTGQKEGENIQLYWTVTQEENLDQYQIERSKDGKSFTSIGKESSLNLAEKTSYSFTDFEPFEDNFYRLKILEKSGQYIYSKVVHISMKAGKEISLSPNPASSFITITNADDYKGYIIYDQSGKLVISGEIKGHKSLINIQYLRTGVYTIRIYNDHQDRTLKFIRVN